jgi:hypothetical protein
MKHFKNLAVLALSGLLALHGLAATLEINGVKVEDSATVGGTPLQLNGAGTRYKAGVFKVYVNRLYLGKKATTADEVVNQPGPKRMSITMVRDIDAAELGKLMTRGMEDNMDKGQMSKLIPGLMRMSQLFSEQKKMSAGDNFTIDWVPGAGTVITVKGVVQGEPFKEAEFFRALMSIWLGSVPADFKLKEALLGGK